MIHTANINAVWASLLMEKLVRCGLTRIVLSPGSRNTPLVVAAARTSGLTATVHFDERAAAFYALGLARALDQPVALACTSGSAVANYLPAVVEAAMDGVPLLLLTADRPPELHGCGANQTIPQDGLFGLFVRHALELSCPDQNIPAPKFLQQLDRALVSLFGRSQGPVHINCPFREPLAPDDDSRDYTEYLRDSESALDRPSFPEAVNTPIPTELPALLAAARRGVIVAGKLDRDTQRESVLRLAARLGWPILPDIQSGLRIGGRPDTIICHVDQILLSKATGADLRPDFVLHIGGRVLSKRLLEWLNEPSIKHYVRLTDSTLPFDPGHRATLTLITDPVTACEALAVNAAPVDHRWLSRWRNREACVARVLNDTFSPGKSQPTDAGIVVMLLNRLTSQATPPVLWSASSLPIRLLDMYAPGSGTALTVMANRGASGIDGTIATAAGYAEGSRRPLVLLIGDLAFLHDLTSLELIHRLSVPITIVLLNNNGGNIFGLLPIAEYRELFTDYFLTPHHHTFEFAARQFGLEYVHCDSAGSFEHVLAKGIPGPKPTLIEVIIAPGSGTSEMRNVATAVRETLESSGNT
jgi:2-succinyl-5-enolpyruvyl-6-hydroxy-3-cyclohexene-1-carboxylate synthase